MPRNATVAEPPTDLVATPAPGALDMLNRWASDPNVSAEKIERLVALLNQQENRRAEEAFNGAIATAQSEMARVGADADNPQTRSRYASYAALDRALRPVYTSHGFGLSFDTADSPHDLHVRVLCYVSHTGGFSRTYHLDMPADGKGARGNDVMTRTHATGSALSYGMRYLLKLIFNVAVGEDDDDGNAASGPKRKPSRASAPPKDVAPAASHPDVDEVITTAQATRFWTIARRRGRTDAEVKHYLTEKFGVASTKEIKRRDYDTICQAVEHPGALLVREPGDDDD